MTTSVSALMLSERFQRNPKLVVSDLGSSGVVVYVPPDSRPLRLPASAWVAIDSLSVNEFTEEQLQKQLKPIPPGHENVALYLQWLLSKRILLRVEIPAQEVSIQPRAPSDRKFSPESQSGYESGYETGDVSESNSIHLFTLNPSWPIGLQMILLRLLRLQIWMVAPMLLIVLAYLGFFLLTPAPSALNLLGVGTEISPKNDFLARIMIGLVSVNLLSTALSWLAQSITGLGDGTVVLRFLFGFIPRFGVNPYKGSAMRSKEWTQESGKALLCVAQPLLTRLGLSSALIVLLASGRLHSGLAGTQLYTVANIMLQISLFTGFVLALPFRISPGYRLMILLTDLPPNTLGQSVKHLYRVVEALIRWLRFGDRSSRKALKSSLSSRRDVGLFAFALVFSALITAKLFLLLLLVIPRLSAGLPDLLGGASQLIYILILLALLIRFINISLTSKLAKLRNNPFKAPSSQAANEDRLPPSSASQIAEIAPRSGQRIYLALLIVGSILLIPIDRTVTGSVMVSTERDLIVRAPADVRIIKIFQRGPSTQVIPAGTPLIQLQSQQLDHELYQSTSDIGRHRNELNTLNEQQDSGRNILREVRASLNISQQAGQVLENQLKVVKTLIREGAFSPKMVQDILLESYELKGDERLKLQQILELQGKIHTAELNIKATQQALDQSLSWQEALLQEKRKMTVEMPFSGFITSSTSGLMWSFVSKGESLLELKEGALNVVNVMIPDHDRSLVQRGQKAEVRLYAEPNQPLAALVQSIRPSGELIDEKVFFEASLRLSKPLSPQLLQSSGAARIKTGRANLFMLILDSLGRFIRVDLWSWSP